MMLRSVSECVLVLACQLVVYSMCVGLFMPGCESNLLQRLYGGEGDVKVGEMND